MNLEKLVADRELCERIPAGEFLDTAFCWHYTEVAGFVCRTSGCEQISGKQWMLERSTSGKIVRYRQRGDQIFPAPTLEEIIRKIRLDLLCGIEHHGDFYVTNRHIGCFEDERATTAALKLWLKLKGIDYAGN